MRESRGDSGGVKCEKMPPGGQRTIGRHVVILLCAACTGCICDGCKWRADNGSLPQHCLHGVHRGALADARLDGQLCLGAACTGCIGLCRQRLPRASLFASALPARGASIELLTYMRDSLLCLGAACTGCISSTCVINPTHSPLPRRCLHGVHLPKSILVLPS